MSNTSSVAAPLKDVLIYVGVNYGYELDALLPLHNRCIGIEADPDLCAFLRNKYQHDPRVEIIHGAASNRTGLVTFNIASNAGASSSLGTFKPEWGHADIKMVRTVTVPALRLADCLAARSISFVDTYISDIQGMDLEALKGLDTFIRNRQIGTVICETTKDAFGNIYRDLPDNSESGFRRLLQENYELSARGWGILQKGRFDEVPEDWWEMDIMWTLKEL